MLFEREPVPIKKLNAFKNDAEDKNKAKAQKMKLSDVDPNDPV